MVGRGGEHVAADAGGLVQPLGLRRGLGAGQRLFGRLAARGDGGGGVLGGGLRLGLACRAIGGGGGAHGGQIAFPVGRGASGFRDGRCPGATTSAACRPGSLLDPGPRVTCPAPPPPVLRKETPKNVIADLYGPHPGVARVPLLLYGILLFCVGLAMYTVGVLMVVPRLLFGLNAVLLPLNEWIVWYSGMPIMAGFVLTLADLFLFFPAKRSTLEVRHDKIDASRVTVALTAYNDEVSISAAVEDFLAHPLVRNVIVVSNNSSDATLRRAAGGRSDRVRRKSPGLWALRISVSAGGDCAAMRPN